MLSTLMPDWGTIKQLLRSYARLHGQPLFKTHAAHEAQDVARFYLDQKLQAAAHRIDAYRLETQTQEGLGKIAGAAKGLAMMGPGTVDITYSILVRDPIGAGKLLAQESANLSHSITTQFAGFVLEWMGESNPAAGGTPFMQGVAKGEWTAAVASIVRGGMGIVKGGLPPRSPIILAPQYAPATAGVTAVIQGVAKPQIPHFSILMVAASTQQEAAPGGGKGRSSKPSKRPDKTTLERLFRETGRNVIALAAQLGVHRYTIYNWFEELGLKDQLPLRERRTSPEKAAVKTVVPNKNLPALYVRLHYNVQAVADHCGIKAAAVHARINAILRKGASSARYFFEVQRKVVDATTYSVDHFRAVLSAHAMNFKRSATFMGVSVRLFLSRLPMSEVEAAVASVLQKQGNNQLRTASELGLGVATVNRYVRNATDSSPLLPHQKRPAGAPKRAYTPRGAYGQLIADLKAADSRKGLVADAHGTSMQNVGRKLNRAKALKVEGAADIHPKTGRPATFTDEAMVAAMKDAKGNRSKAAKKLGVKWSALCRRWKLYKITDKKMLKALKQSQFDISVAAKNLKIHPNDIRARIRKPDSLLSQHVQILISGEVAPKTKPPVTQ